MVTRKKLPRLPTFSHSAIHLADLCARELWHGRAYEDGKPLEFIDVLPNEEAGKPNKLWRKTHSDEDLLETFSSPFLAYALDSSIPISEVIDIHHIEKYFISAVRLNVLKAKNSTIDYSNGIQVLFSDLVTHYKQWNSSESEENYSEIGMELTRVLGEAFYRTNSSQQTGAQIALASRLLFFAIPDFPLFNYSTSISDGLKLRGSASEIIPQYFETLAEGYERNFDVLSSFEMPYATKLSPIIWNRARSAGWWQRRIFDLALVLFFRDNEDSTISVNDNVKNLFFTKALTHL
jgi:hypothetical protein